MYSGPDRTARLIAGAKKEGVVNIYSSFTVDDLKVLGGAFEKKYGVKLNVWRSSSEDILQRAVVEARGGRYDVDAIETSAAEMESLHREQLLQEVKSPYLADVNPAALLPHRDWVGVRLNIIPSAYNYDLIKKATTCPRATRTCSILQMEGQARDRSGTTISGSRALITAMGEDKGLKLFRDLVRTNGLSGAQGATR